MSTTHAPRRRRTRAQWQQLIARAEHSTLSIEAFCRGEGITTASFYTWRKRLRNACAAQVCEVQEQSATFLDLGTLNPPGASSGGWEIELDLGGGAVLRLRRP